MVKSIYLYGASGHGLVCADIARACGYEQIIFLDDAKKISDKHGEILPFNPELKKHDIFISIGDCALREKLQIKVQNAGFNVVNLIHPSAIISSSASLGVGVCVMPNAVINAYAKIHDGVIINTGAIIEHECDIGAFSHICPGSKIAGASKIGSRVWLGIGSNVIQCLNIADDAYIGAGSVVIKDIPSGVKAYGNPCKVWGQINQG